MSKYRSFDEVLKELDMDEDELKRLVSEGQIRAFRDEDRMKFRAEDVANIAATRQTDYAPGGMGEEIELGETQVGKEGLQVVEETDETMLDLGNLSGDKDFEDTGATSVPTVELSDVGGESDQDATLTEELVFDETDELGGLDFGEKDADATQKIEGGLNLGDDDELGLDTEPVAPTMPAPSRGRKQAPPPPSDEEDLSGLDELDEAPMAPAPMPMRMGGPPMAMPGPMQFSEQVKYVEIVPNEGIAWKILTGVSFLLFLLLCSTGPMMGMIKADDVGGNTFGSMGHSLYLKSGDPRHGNDPYRTEPGKPRQPIAVAIGTKGNAVWPGMEIIRTGAGLPASTSPASDAPVEPGPEQPAGG